MWLTWLVSGWQENRWWSAAGSWLCSSRCMMYVLVRDCIYLIMRLCEVDVKKADRPLWADGLYFWLYCLYWIVNVISY